jgi:Tfp pilus assembly protein PilV
MENKNILQSGQTIVEAIFAVVIMTLTITGVVSLIVTSAGSKNQAQERKTATRLAEKVAEDLTYQKDIGPSTFWQLSDIPLSTDVEFPGYVYSVGFSVVNYPNCNVGVTDCVEARINIGWSGARGSSQSFLFNRFFSKK